jgi:DNA replication protein DnaC
VRPPADECLHDLIAERYEQAATVVTSNLDFGRLHRNLVYRDLSAMIGTTTA